METTQGCDFYRGAVTDLEAMTTSRSNIVAITNVYVGLDANVELGGFADAVSGIGSVTTRDAVDERSALLGSFMQRWALRAANIFAGGSDLLHRLSGSIPLISKRTETHRLYSTGRLRSLISLWFLRALGASGGIWRAFRRSS